MASILFPISLAATLLMLLLTAVSVGADSGRQIRLGYLDHPGSLLCLLASEQGLFRAEGLSVALVRFPDSGSGLSALSAGRIDAGAFALGETLQRIAGGKELKIVAGGGTAPSGKLPAGQNEAAALELEGKGVVLAAGSLDKISLVKLVSALIRAHQSLQLQPEAAWRQALKLLRDPKPQRAVRFDPNPDYWRIEKLWRQLQLQGEGRPRDFLANHVYEEIYCDALDRLALGDGRDNAVLQELKSRAVCVPDCCSVPSGNLSTIKGGSR